MGIPNLGCEKTLDVSVYHLSILQFGSFFLGPPSPKKQIDITVDNLFRFPSWIDLCLDVFKSIR